MAGGLPDAAMARGDCTGMASCCPAEHSTHCRNFCAPGSGRRREVRNGVRPCARQTRERFEESEYAPNGGQPASSPHRRVQAPGISIKQRAPGTKGARWCLPDAYVVLAFFSVRDAPLRDSRRAGAQAHTAYRATAPRCPRVVQAHKARPAAPRLRACGPLRRPATSTS